MKKLIISLIVLMFAAAPAGANMVVDGSFEFGHKGKDDWVPYEHEEAIGAWTPYVEFGRFMYLGVDHVDGIVEDMIIPDGAEFLHMCDRYDTTTIKQVVSGFCVGGKIGRAHV